MGAEKARRLALTAVAVVALLAGSVIGSGSSAAAIPRTTPSSSGAALGPCPAADRAVIPQPEPRLWSVPSAGGAPVPRTLPQDHIWGYGDAGGPKFFPAPDGKRTAIVSSFDYVEVRSWDGSPSAHVAVPERVYENIDIVWSPDSTKLAFQTHPAPGSNQWVLWVASATTGATSARVGPGNEVGNVTWSPDSTRLAFVDDDRLWTVNPTGAVSVVQVSVDPVEVHSDSSVQWSPDSQQLAWRGFDPADPIRLLTRKADASGPVHDVSGPTNDLVEHLWTPDGSAMVYVTGDEIKKRPADASSPAVTLPVGLAGMNQISLVGYSSAGTKLAFLARQNIDPTRWHLYTTNPDGTGTWDVSWTTHVPSSFSVAKAVWSRSTDDLAFTVGFDNPGHQAQFKLYTAAATGFPSLITPVQQDSIGPFGFDASVARVVWQQDVGPPDYHRVYSAPRNASSAPVQIAPAGATLGQPTFLSSTGDVLYAGKGTTTGNLFTTPFDVQPTAVAGTYPSPDGTKTAIVGSSITITDRDGVSTQTLPYPSFPNIFAWSPDSSRVAWMSLVNTAPSVWGMQVYVAPVDGSSPPITMITAPDVPYGDGQSALRPGERLVWSADGTRLAFVQSQVPLPDLWIADPNVPGSGHATGAHAFRPRFAPDGSAIAFTDVAQPKKLMTLAAPFTGSATEAGSVPTGGIFTTEWSPDSSRLAVGVVETVISPDFNNYSHTSALYIMKGDGSPGTKIGKGIFPQWSPDGSHLAFEDWVAAQYRVVPPWDPGHPVILFAGGTNTAHVARPDGTDDRPIAAAPARATEDYGYPWQPLSGGLQFSPDGAEASFFGSIVTVDGAVVHRVPRTDEAWHLPLRLQAICDTTRSPGYHPLAQAVRLLDTRTSAVVGPGGHVDVQITGANGVPSSHVSSAMFNTTVVGSTTATHVTVSPTGSPLPATSNINVPAGDIRPNLVLAKVGAGGKVTLTNNSGNVDLLVDLAGWYDDGVLAFAGGGLAYQPLSPSRALDTRDGTGAPAGRVGAGQHVDFGLGAGVPAGAHSVVMNVTGVNPSVATHVTAAANGAALPGTSNLNLPKGSTRPNLVVVPIGDAAKVSLWNNAGDIDLLADVVGYFSGSPGTGVSSVTPLRIADTRDGTGGVPVGKLGGGLSITVPVAGVAPVPANATAVVVNLTGEGPSAATHLTAWPATETMPVASNLNLPAGLTAANLAIVKLGSDGKIKVFNNAGAANVIVDVVGYVA